MASSDLEITSMARGPPSALEAKLAAKCVGNNMGSNAAIGNFN